MERQAEARYLLDMGDCEPRSDISTSFEPGKWTAVSYEVADGAGTMLFAAPHAGVGPVTLRLNAPGWHAIWIATFLGAPYQAAGLTLFLKLTDDPAYSRSTVEGFRPGKDIVPPEMVGGATDVMEAYWKAADLTGQDLVFHRPAAGAAAEDPSNICYVKLVPLSEAEIARAQRDMGRQDTRRLVANHDSGQHAQWAYASRADMRNEFEGLRDSDFGMILWGCSLGLGTYYPSQVGSEQEFTPGFGGHHGIANASRDRHRLAGIDPLQEAVACAHEIGIEIYPQVRMEGAQLPPHHRSYGGPGAFFYDHPEWRCVTRDGNPARTLSHAFPEVRAKYVDLFREWVDDYGADGMNIVFCRSWPYVLFEEPVRASFREAHRQDMLALDPYDDRVLAHQAGFVTQLLRETRAMLDEVGGRLGRRLGTCYTVPTGYRLPDFPDRGPLTSCLCYGMDVETWVREGLVDHLVVHMEQTMPADGSGAVPAIEAFGQITEGSETLLHADLYPRRQSAASMCQRAKTCYDAGVDGLCFWDSHGRISRLSGWAMHRLLGHRDELDSPEMVQFAASLFRCVPLVSLDGYSLDGPWGMPSDG